MGNLQKTKKLSYLHLPKQSLWNQTLLLFSQRSLPEMPRHQEGSSRCSRTTSGSTSIRRRSRVSTSTPASSNLSYLTMRRRCERMSFGLSGTRLKRSLSSSLTGVPASTVSGSVQTFRSMTLNTRVQNSRSSSSGFRR